MAIAFYIHHVSVAVCFPVEISSEKCWQLIFYEQLCERITQQAINVDTSTYLYIISVATLIVYRYFSSVNQQRSQRFNVLNMYNTKYIQCSYCDSVLIYTEYIPVYSDTNLFGIGNCVKQGVFDQAILMLESLYRPLVHEMVRYRLLEEISLVSRSLH